MWGGGLKSVHWHNSTRTGTEAPYSTFMTPQANTGLIRMVSNNQCWPNQKLGLHPLSLSLCVWMCVAGSLWETGWQSSRNLFPGQAMALPFISLCNTATVVPADLSLFLSLSHTNLCVREKGAWSPFFLAASAAPLMGLPVLFLLNVVATTQRGYVHQEFSKKIEDIIIIYYYYYSTLFSCLKSPLKNI